MQIDVHSSKRAVVVGASGQDGSYLTSLLASKGYCVFKVCKDTHDITDPLQVGVILEDVAPDEVYFLSAHHGPSEAKFDSSSGELKTSFDVNTLSLGYFLALIVEKKKQPNFFYASSSHVFAMPSGEILTESSEKRPDSIYGVSKLAGMQLCDYYRRRYGLKISVGILFNHESPLRKIGYLSKRIASAAAKIHLERRGELVLGDLSATVDWGAAEDFVHGIYKMTQLDEGGEFIVSTGQPHTVAEFAEVAFRHVGLDYKDFVVSDASLVRRPHQTRIGSYAKLHQYTGWRPLISFEQMIGKMVDHELQVLESRQSGSSGLGRNPRY